MRSHLLAVVVAGVLGGCAVRAPIAVHQPAAVVVEPVDEVIDEDIYAETGSSCEHEETKEVKDDGGNAAVFLLGLMFGVIL
ncbi:MAG: hypothetical protein ACTHU0_39275 [Kofleriaceae bacterium]